MSDKNRMKVGLLPVLVVVSGLCLASDLSVGFGEIGGIDVKEGQSETFTGTLTLSPDATFYKTGTGSLTVPSANLENAVPYGIDVLAGKLTLNGAAGTPSATAPAVTQTAALWLDATDLTEGDPVSTWNDVRGGTGRYSAVAKWLCPVAGADQVPPVVAVTNGMKGVYFGGKSGKYMGFQKAAADAEITKVRHLFVVHGAYATYGSLLGDSKQDAGAGLLANVSFCTQTTLGVPYLSNRGDLDYYDFQGRFFLDGRLFDPRTTNVKIGRSLFEGDLQAKPQRLDSIYYNYFSNYNTDDKKRPGGDFMCEVILFTNLLTEVERLDVERYLLNKWNLPQTEVNPGSGKSFVAANQPRGTGLVKVAEGASVEVTSSAGETTPPFQFDGEGAVKKVGEGTLLVGGGANRPFPGDFTLAGGEILVHGGVMPPVTVGPGEKWTSSNWPSTRVGTVDGDATSGVRIARAACASGQSVKTGSGELLAGGIAPGISRMTVEEGVFHLVGKERDGVQTDAGICADEIEIPNNSFEMPFEWSDDYGRKHGWRELNGWKNDMGSTGAKVQFVTASCSKWTTWSSGGYALPDGTNALMIVTDGYGYTEVTVPRAGAYEVSYYATSRYGSPRMASSKHFGRRSQVDVMFNERRVGSVQVNEGAFTRFRHRFSVSSAEAGVKMKFGFKSLQSYSENCMIIDDVHIRAAGEFERTDVVKVPGGDFEDSSYVSEDGTPGTLSVSAFCRCMTSPDWTLSIADDAPSRNPTNGYVAICTAGTPMLYSVSNTDRFTPFYPQADGRAGSGVLGFIGKYGTATTAKAFNLPKGKWLLRGEIVWNPMSCKAPFDRSESAFAGSPAVEAKLTRCNSSVVSLGTVTATKHLMERCIWPTVIEVTEDEGEAVLLSITQTQANGACALDNLEFVPDAAGERDKNFFPNGTFETTDSVETFDCATDGISYSTAAGQFKYSTDSWAFGFDIVDGAYCFRLHNHRGLQEKVVFPAPGLYRLTVPAHTRANGTQWGHRELRAAVVLNDGSELEVFRSPIPFTPSFQEVSYLFRMPESGAHYVRIHGIPIPSGTTTSGGKDSADRSTLIDGVRLVKVEEGDGTLDAPNVAEDVRVNVEDGAKLALDYDGKVIVRGLRLGGESVSGTVSAKTYPDYITGMGEVEIRPLGCILIVR